MKRLLKRGLPALLLLCALALWAGLSRPSGSTVSFDLETLPAYDGEPYVVLSDNQPVFSPEEQAAPAGWESYSPLDALGRCGTAFALVGPETLPTEERGAIGQIKPSGWHTVKYDFVDGKYLYNRCHLIGYQLTAENANEQNLITGTRAFNVEGMLPFENLTADYVKETGNHVLYRVTPLFEGTELVARGVEMEALSVEDGGEGVCFHVFVYNAQNGVTIDYATGESREGTDQGGNATPGTDTGGEPPGEGAGQTPRETAYVLNTSSRKFHLPSCAGVQQIQSGNRAQSEESRDALLEQGYTPCGTCRP